MRFATSRIIKSMFVILTRNNDKFRLRQEVRASRVLNFRMNVSSIVPVENNQHGDISSSEKIESKKAIIPSKRILLNSFS
mmetsp:Transcript_7032/g.16005  ORF Transcript_7032/g.16005 Transcript_7032/m.16005 type:complete len:80 (+) Transcript_7032:1149-1388(+)